MDRVCFTITISPQGDVYRRLLDYAVDYCTIALLVVRPSLRLSQAGMGVLRQLDSHLKEKRISSEWPGTRLLNGVAQVFLYNFGPACAALLKDATDALYTWQQPDLPEDLCLLRANEEAWLVSIAHEEDSYLCLSEDEKSRLLTAIPQLVLSFPGTEGS